MSLDLSITHCLIPKLAVSDSIKVIDLIKTSFGRDCVDMHYICKHDVAVLCHKKSAGEPGDLIGLVLIRILDGHCVRKIYELNSLCTEPAMRRQGVASGILRYVHNLLPFNAYAKLYIDKDADHDALVLFYVSRGFFTVYTNSAETCMKTVAKQASNARRIACALMSGVVFCVSATGMVILADRIF